MKMYVVHFDNYYFNSMFPDLDKADYEKLYESIKLDLWNNVGYFKNFQDAKICSENVLNATSEGLKKIGINNFKVERLKENIIDIKIWDYDEYGSAIQICIFEKELL